MFISLPLPNHTSSLKGFRAGTKDKNLVARPEAEVIEEWYLLDCSL